MSPRLLALADIALPRVVEDPLSPGLNHPGAALVVFVAVVVIEAGLLRWLRWGGWGRVSLVAFVVNLVTTLLGVLLGIFAPALPRLAWLPLAFVLTVPIEATLLKAFQPAATLARALVASLVINAASYALLVLLMLAPRLVAAPPGPLPPRYRGAPAPQPIPRPEQTPTSPPSVFPTPP